MIVFSIYGLLFRFGLQMGSNPLFFRLVNKSRNLILCCKKGFYYAVFIVGPNETGARRSRFSLNST
ncbi:hypothetical protein BES34_019880 [Leptospira inadai serovar Lyme]|uniref:Lipoprotein n=1 Tax=Leptospira inadai serovar Lyme TaxID=293084 RepID=A0ABX4YDC7_9LEPT|nr:hypothetical protein BES34_019880 [Leptospira inadai serovar Lyme]